MTARDVFRSRAFIAGVVQSVLWIALGVALMHLVPSFAKIFKDFDYEDFSALTVAVLKLGYLLIYYWYLALLPILLWPFLNWGVTLLLSPHPVSLRLWRAATWTLPFLCAAVVVLALFRPLIGLVTKMPS